MHFLPCPWNLMQLSFALCFNIINWINPGASVRSVLCQGGGSEMIRSDQTGPILTDHNKKVIVTTGAVLCVFILCLYCNLTLVPFKGTSSIWQVCSLKAFGELSLSECKRVDAEQKRGNCVLIAAYSTIFVHFIILLYHLHWAYINFSYIAPW